MPQVSSPTKISGPTKPVEGAVHPQSFILHAGVSGSVRIPVAVRVDFGMTLSVSDSLIQTTLNVDGTGEKITVNKASLLHLCGSWDAWKKPIDMVWDELHQHFGKKVAVD
jgi:hypothetical protein